MVTGVPPAVLPVFGLTAVTVGAVGASGPRAMAMSSRPYLTVMGVPAVLVAIVIGVTVPETSLVT